MRFVSIWLPHWPIERLLRQSRDMARKRGHSAQPIAHVLDDRPLALVLPSTRGDRIHAVNGQARALGVAAGMSLTDARAACPGLTTHPADPEADLSALRRLAMWSGRYSPLRNIEGDDGLWIDVTGTTHLFDDEGHLLLDLVSRLGAAGLTVLAALADTPGAAFALARHGRPGLSQHSVDIVAANAFVQRAGRLGEAIALLPVDLLRLEPDTVLLLRRLGLKEIGRLDGIARGGLARRFRDLPGQRPCDRLTADVLRRLDQAMGRAVEPRAPMAEPVEYSVQRVFTEPLISHEGIVAALSALTVDLAAMLEHTGQGLRRVVATFYRVDATVSVVDVGTSAPCRDAPHLERLLLDRLGMLDAGFGIDALTLEAPSVTPWPTSQSPLPSTLDEGDRSTAHRLIDRLSVRLGPNAVVRLEPHASHLPERSEKRIPAIAAPARHEGLSAASRGAADFRPPLLLAPPERIEVMAEIPDGAPVRFRWRRLLHSVVRADGPERIEPEWWLAFEDGGKSNFGATPRSRDYYRLENAHGTRFWVFRHGRYDCETEPAPPAWYVHGFYS